MLRRTKVEEELKRAVRRVLNIQSLVVRLLSHSSSLECVERKAYNEENIVCTNNNSRHDIIRKFAIEFLCKSKQCWCVREQM